MSNSAEATLDAAIKQAGVRAFTAAFVTGSGCNPIWGDTQGLDESVSTDAMARAEREGAQTIVSFGGEAGAELAQSCTDLGALTAAYQKVIDKYRADPFRISRAVTSLLVNPH
jgi:chitinase